ncbi:uncharacterized protein LOC113326421 [Papaver somniferum]|uniref:uncharacterized protein LOC113326421 n=1 Tax=Papaver somniferum TaxID=3469 RepID=UPI000E6FB241|nr:uncharacterized protein LOC113326421 [Papaver somniferum]
MEIEVSSQSAGLAAFRLSIPDTCDAPVNPTHLLNPSVQSSPVASPIQSPDTGLESKTLKSIIDYHCLHPNPSSLHLLPTPIEVCSLACTSPMIIPNTSKSHYPNLQSKNTQKFNKFYVPAWIRTEVNRLFDFGIKLVISFPTMPNHTRKFLISRISSSGPVIKPIPILPTKKQIHEDFVVQNVICVDGVDNISVHEERQYALPLPDTNTPEFPPGFEPLTEDISGTPSTVLWLKLKALKEKLKIWKKEVFGHTNTRLNAILSDIQTLDGIMEDNILNEEERIMQLQNKVEFEKISKMEETAWKIKSNTKWLQEADRNTSFFISNASARRRYNGIRQLYIGDELVSDRGRLEDHIVKYYKTLFTEEEVIRPDLEGIEFDSITSTEASILEANFTEEEVLHAISDIANDKAPGPDGFLILFFQKCWRFIKEDIMSTVKEFCTTGTINSKHNSTFITLVPIKDHIETINDCRPICLLTSVYKIIAKVLATRLKLVMDKLISPVQYAYIEGRKIIDGTLIANELVDSRLRSEKPGIVCKIDLEKDFDRINWRYLEFVLQQMSFSKKWCDWLRFCYSTSSFSVLINGSSFGYFTSTRGVRQGCPVSPLLFNVSMEGFSRFIDKAANQSLFSGFFVSPTSIIVNHLHYADDTIFFVDNNKEELLNLFSALHCFEFIAGLKVNTSKTRLIGVEDVPDLAIWAEEFGCSTDCLPFMYLGMPLGSASVIKILEKKMRNFLWEYKDGAKTSHLVNWDMVHATKERGGFGVCNFKLMNQALSAKWCWRYGVEKNKLWYKIIVDKYGDDFSFWNPGKITQSYGVSCWRSIAEMAGLIYDNCTLYLHSGRGISFWNDVWCGQLPLAAVYPNLYKLSRDRNVKLADMVSSNGNWKFDFKRVLHSLEVEDYAALLTVIGDNPPSRDGLPDTRRWRLNTTGVFTVKSLYAKLVSEFGVDNFPYHFIWKSAIPHKINILMWSLIHGKLNTIDLLLHKGLNLYNSCALCGIGAESQDHLFLHCKIAYKIWFSLIPKTGWVRVLSGSMKILADMWHHHLFSSSDDDLANEVKSAVLPWVAATGHRIHLSFSSSVLNTRDSIFM